jgi:hypothetical protein
MKALLIILLASMTYAVTAPAFAGRDETQMRAVQAAIEKKRADSLALAQAQAQRGLAGPTGYAGAPGPATKAPATRRDPSTHP